jgi:hypothetical protein
MRKRWLMCVLWGGLAWGQAAPGGPPPAQSAQASAAGTPSQADSAAAVPADAAVITVRGVCPAEPKTPAATGAAAPPAADCETVITKAEFEKLMSSIPNANPQMRRQIATVLPRLIALSDAAIKQGLDKTPQYQELLKVQKMQLLSNELQRKISEDAAKVPEADIENYYQSNREAFEQFNLDRLFIPRTKQAEAGSGEDSDKDEKLTEEQKKAKAAEGEQAMSKLADALRRRAVAGEDFVKLQKEAFQAAGMKIESPTVTLPKVRRTGLPPPHGGVFALKVGEVSQLISDSGGHYIYKINSKDELTLDQAREEIHNTLQNQHARDLMDKVNNSFKVETNEAYFGAVNGGQVPPSRGPNSRVPPTPVAPAAQPHNPPAQQPPAQSPGAKPN